VPGRGEPRHVADLGHEHRRPHWADPGDGLDRPIPLVAGEPGGDPPVGQPDLDVEGVDQAQVGIHPGPVGPIQRRCGELGAPARPEQILDLQVQALLGQYRVHPGLEPGPDLHQLGPMPDQLAQLPHRRRRQPRLR
jgi:hypothetical protein